MSLIETKSVTYIMSVTNNGTDADSNVKTIIQIPEGTTYSSHLVSKGLFNEISSEWIIGDMQVGEVQTLRLVTSVNSGLNEEVTFQAEASGDNLDLNLTNNIVLKTIKLVSTSATAVDSINNDGTTGALVSINVVSLLGYVGCSVGAETFAVSTTPNFVNIVAGDIINTGSTFSVTPSLDGTWSFEYDILCGGLVTSTATISGTATAVVTTATATAPNAPNNNGLISIDQVIDVTALTGYVACSSGSETYALASTPNFVNLTGTDVAVVGSTVTVTPPNAGAWSVDYAILCGGVEIDTNTISGTATAATTPISFFGSTWLSGTSGTGATGSGAATFANSGTNVGDFTDVIYLQNSAGAALATGTVALLVTAGTDNTATLTYPVGGNFNSSATFAGTGVFAGQQAVFDSNLSGSVSNGSTLTFIKKDAAAAVGLDYANGTHTVGNAINNATIPQLDERTAAEEWSFTLSVNDGTNSNANTDNTTTFRKVETVHIAGGLVHSGGFTDIDYVYDMAIVNSLDNSFTPTTVTITGDNSTSVTLAKQALGVDLRYRNTLTTFPTASNITLTSDFNLSNFLSVSNSTFITIGGLDKAVGVADGEVVHTHGSLSVGIPVRVYDQKSSTDSTDIISLVNYDLAGSTGVLPADDSVTEVLVTVPSRCICLLSVTTNRADIFQTGQLEVNYGY